MKIYRKKIKELFSILNNMNLYEMPISSSFRFMLTENLQILLNEVTKIDDLMKEPPEITDYKSKKIELFVALNIKDEESLKNLSEENKKILEEQMISLNAQYAEVLANIDKLEVFRKDFMDEETELPLKIIHIDKAPNISKDIVNHWAIWNSIKILFHD